VLNATHGNEQGPHFVPVPKIGRVYREGALVGPGDAAADGNAHLDAIVRWIQEIAYADVADSELREPGAWVVRRTRLLVRRAPQFGERIELATFCSALGASVAERRTRIEGSEGADVDAAVLWVYIDDEKRTPERFTEEFMSIYGPSTEGRRARSGLKHPSPPEGAARSTWRFGAADVDLANHVNNVAFVRILVDLVLGTSAVDGLELDAEYRVPASAGDVSVLSADDRVWVVDRGDKPTFASLSLTGMPGDR